MRIIKKINLLLFVFIVLTNNVFATNEQSYAVVQMEDIHSNTINRSDEEKSGPWYMPGKIHGLNCTIKKSDLSKDNENDLEFTIKNDTSLKIKMINEKTGEEYFLDPGICGDIKDGDDNIYRFFGLPQHNIFSSCFKSNNKWSLCCQPFCEDAEELPQTTCSEWKLDQINSEESLTPQDTPITSEKFIMESGGLDTPVTPRLNYQITFNHNPKTASDYKYLFILKNSKGNVIKTEPFNSSKFTVKLTEKQKETLCLRHACFTVSLPIITCCALSQPH